MLIKNIFNSEIKKIFRIAFIIWGLCFIFLAIRNWDGVTHLVFNDTDDLMRYHQYSEWIKNKNWYLQPDPQFNPEDGVIMHWSRIADIPLAGVALIALVFTDWDTALAISNTVTPLIYLLIIIITISLIAYKVFGVETAKIAMLLPLLSPISIRFIPGSLDHHNLQFILLSSFILIISIKSLNLEKKCILISLCIATSLWIGLENIYSFVITLSILLIYGLLYNLHYLKVTKKICLYTSIFSTLALFLNRPIDELIIPQYDVLSLPFLFCFIAAYILCAILLELFKNTEINNRFKRVLTLTILGLVLFSPIVVMYPSLIKGGYADYPILLKENWLSFVSEARPLIKTIPENIEDIGFFIAIIPAIISLFFFKNKKELTYWTLYAIFLVNLLLATFWQIRMYSTCMVAAIPLQAYTCFSLREKCSLSISKTIILFLCLPTLLLVSTKVILDSNENTQSQNEIYDLKYNSSFFAATNLINKNHIENKIILPTIDLGAAIIANTKNASISAPYHRNIRGNTDAINFYLETNDIKVKDILLRNKIDYILVEKNFANTLGKKHKNENIMVERLLHNKNIPNYLELVDKNENSNILLYKFISSN